MLTTEGTNNAGSVTANNNVDVNANSSGGAGSTTNGAAGGLKWEDVVKTLPDDLKNDANLTPIKSVESLVKSFINAQKMVGNKVSLPDPKHATTDDYLQLFRKLGAPEKLDDYKFKLPEGVKDEDLDAQVMAKLKETAVANGILPWQFEKLFDVYYNTLEEKTKGAITEEKTKIDTDIANLKKEWGAAYDTQVKKANVAFKELVPDEADRTRLIEDGLGTHPVVMKMLTNASKYFKEDVFLGHGEGTLSGFTPEAALQRAREIQGDPNHPYRQPTHPNHQAAKKEVADLYKVAFPE